MSSSRPAAGAAIFFGLIAIAAIPAAVTASEWLGRVKLLHAGYAGVAAAFVAGLLALLLARRARHLLERSVKRAGEGLVRTGRWLAWIGLYVALIGGIALGFYGLLRLRS
jgi:hypothetical protein